MSKTKEELSAEMTRTATICAALFLATAVASIANCTKACNKNEAEMVPPKLEAQKEACRALLATPGIDKETVRLSFAFGGTCDF